MNNRTFSYAQSKKLRPEETEQIAAADNRLDNMTQTYDYRTRVKDADFDFGF